MALFFFRRKRHRPGQHNEIAGDCPQPPCNHPSHGGVSVPCRYCGTSTVGGVVVHHVRCVLNPAHHLRFAKVGGRWHRVES